MLEPWQPRVIIVEYQRTQMQYRVTPAAATMVEQFAVINTHPHKEAAVVAHLVRQGYAPYCPKLLRRVAHARQVKEVLRPMFPGYLFVSLDCALQAWSPISSTFGVRRIVKFGDRPALLDGMFIDALKGREINGSIIRPPNPYKVGETVKFVDGAFEGIVAQIIELKDADRVVVLLDMLQRAVPMTTNIRGIRPEKLPD